MARLCVSGAALALMGALCACGGGGSSGNAPIPIRSITPTASPTATPTPDPNAPGSTFAYTGTLAQTYTLYGTPAPQVTASASPAPTSTPWVSTTTWNVTQATTVAAGATFAGKSGLNNLATQETDVGPHSTTTVSGNIYETNVADASRTNGVDATVVGTTSLDSSGVALQTTYATPNEIVDELPHVVNATWTNSAARTQNENDPSGEMTSIAYNPDGSYNAQYSFPEGGTAAIQANSDLSSVYQAPYFGDGSTNSAISVDAPSLGTIVINVLFAIGLGEAGTISLNDWYPSPAVLATDTFVDDGPVALPTTCNVGASFASASVIKLVRTTTRLDTTFGEMETLTDAEYVSALGVECTVLHDDVVAYYDYSGQFQGVVSYYNSPLEETVTDETLALTQATYGAAASRRTASASRPAPAIGAMPSVAGLEHAIERARLKRITPITIPESPRMRL